MLTERVPVKPAIYGHIEHCYCAPVAEALAKDHSFASFMLDRTGIMGWQGDFRCMKREQAQLRKTAKFWWKNVFCPESTCKCESLKGREVDILVVFARNDGARLGLHIECKNPDDRFRVGQAENYRDRLSCWTQPGRGPRTIPAHEIAVSLLICDRDNKHSSNDINQFNGIVYFDEIAQRLPVYPDLTVI
jgi:hypothetical protein